MPAPRKGEKGYRDFVEKCHKGMLLRYGTEDEIHWHMKEIGRKGGRASHKGGFTQNPEAARVAGRLGAKKRWANYYKEKELEDKWKKQNPSLSD